MVVVLAAVSGLCGYRTECAGREPTAAANGSSELHHDHGSMEVRLRTPGSGLDCAIPVGRRNRNNPRHPEIQTNSREAQEPTMSDYGSCFDPCSPPDFEKDPDATEDYEFLWGPDLNGDTIATSTFLLPDGMTQASSSNTDTTATIFVSGGSRGVTYRVTNRITTAGGRTRDKTIRIKVSEQ